MTGNRALGFHVAVMLSTRQLKAAAIAAAFQLDTHRGRTSSG